MKTKLLAMMLLAGSAAFAQPRISVGVNAGGFGVAFNQAPRAYASNIPPCPGPGFTWVDGYWQAPVRGFRVQSRFNDRDDRRFNDRDDRRFGDRDDRGNVDRGNVDRGFFSGSNVNRTNSNFRGR